MRIAWPLTGRSEELSVIEAGLSDPEIGSIVICGPADVGKSRIAREALAAAAAKGCQVRWAVGTSSARGLPLGAFDAWAPAAATDTLQLVRGVIESLTSAPPNTTVIVGVDDAHLLDDLSTFGYWTWTGDPIMRRALRRRNTPRRRLIGPSRGRAQHESGCRACDRCDTC